MRPHPLTPSQRRRLNANLRDNCDARKRQQVAAVLAACEGGSVGAIAQQCGVSRQSVYKWIGQLTRKPDRKRTAPRRGRPTVWSPAMLELVRQALAGPPAALGLTSEAWSARQLQQYLERVTGRRLSQHTIRQGLSKAGFVWRRSRFVPASQARASKPR